MNRIELLRAMKAKEWKIRTAFSVKEPFLLISGKFDGAPFHFHGAIPPPSKTENYGEFWNDLNKHLNHIRQCRGGVTDDSVGSTLRGQGQIFIRTIREIAQLSDPPYSIYKDWKSLKEWLECGDNDFDNAMLKKIGIAWQSYLAIGKSPSQKLDFELYKEIAIEEKWQIIPIPDYIVSIFDRMLATDGEVNVGSMEKT